jgi:hypothetical protein
MRTRSRSKTTNRLRKPMPSSETATKRAMKPMLCQISTSESSMTLASLVAWPQPAVSLKGKLTMIHTEIGSPSSFEGEYFQALIAAMTALLKALSAAACCVGAGGGVAGSEDLRALDGAIAMHVELDDDLALDARRRAAPDG